MPLYRAATLSQSNSGGEILRLLKGQLALA